MHLYSFEKLEIWADARKLVKLIYKVTSDFPPDEKFGLVSQMRRAAISVVSNIAEGSARSTSKDKAYFSQLAYSSLIELLNQLIVSYDLGFLKNEVLIECRAMIEMLTRRIAALRNTQLKTLPSKP